tara:strand:- start:978 stop:2405 length:1428 start_codon:yes stop_codon:yes gene_type:complete
LRNLDDIKKNGVKINLTETDLFLKKLSNEINFKISSPYPFIHGITCSLKKADRCFNFNSEPIKSIGPPIGPPARYQHKSYGFTEPFKVINNELEISIYKGVGSISMKFGKESLTYGNINRLRTKDYETDSGIHRAIIPKPKYHELPIKYLNTEGFNIGNALRVAGYFQIKVNDKNYGIFDYKINKKESLIIECYDVDSSSNFDKESNAIIYCFALISGQLFRDEITTLKFEDSTFTKITGFDFKKLEESKSGMQAIDSRLYSDFYNTKRTEGYFPVKVFQNLVNKSLNDLRLFRAVKIMSESADFPFEIRASTYSVALETIKNIIIEENEEKINPFKKKKTASDVIKNLKKIISDIPESEFNNKKVVINKLEQINQIGNKDSFLMSFKVLKIKLNDDDKRCLNMRNDFLHGRIPYDNEDEIVSFELLHVVVKLHFLVCSLILKYTGYSGYLLNNIKYISHVHFKKTINESLFRKI